MAKSKKTDYQLIIETEFNKHSEDHKKDLIKIFNAIGSFQEDFTQSYDVTTETARELQNAYYLLFNIMPAEIREKHRNY